MTDLPAPPVPADVDLRGYPFTPIFRSRLFGSSFHARATDSEWRAGVTLWLKSWDQMPAGSLPDDDVDLCRLAELGRDAKTWKKLRDGAMRGWFKCADGRLYHTVVAQGVNEAWKSKCDQRSRTEIARAAKQRKRSSVTDSVTDTVTDFATDVETERVRTSITETVTTSVTEPVTGSNRERTEQREKEIRNNTAAIAGASGGKRSAMDVLQQALDEAVGEAFCPVSFGRMDLSRPFLWITNGCDLQLDILPTIRRLSAGKTGSIKTWKFFEGAVADAKTARLAPMAEGRAHEQGNPDHGKGAGSEGGGAVDAAGAGGQRRGPVSLVGVAARLDAEYRDDRPVPSGRPVLSDASGRQLQVLHAGAGGRGAGGYGAVDAAGAAPGAEQRDPALAAEDDLGSEGRIRH